MKVVRDREQNRHRQQNHRIHRMDKMEILGIREIMKTFQETVHLRMREPASPEPGRQEAVIQAPVMPVVIILVIMVQEPVIPETAEAVMVEMEMAEMVVLEETNRQNRELEKIRMKSFVSGMRERLVIISGAKPWTKVN